MASYGIPLLLLVLLAVVVVVGLAAVMLPRPILTFALFAAVAVTGVSDAIGYVGPLSLYLLALAAAVAALLYGMRFGRVRLLGSPVLAAAAVFLATRVASLAVAPDPAVARSTVVAEAKELLVLVLAAAFFSSLRSGRPVIAAATLALASLAGLSLIQEFLFANSTTFGGLSNVPLPSELPGLTARHSGPGADVNFWARTLALFTPFALSFAMGARGYRRLAWLTAAGTLVGGIYLTQSRGALLALGFAVVLWAMLYVRSVGRVLLVSAGLVAVVALIVPEVGTRLASLATISGDAGVADQSLVDRAAVQRVGWAMVRDHPFFGVGAGNFTIAEPPYRRVVPELSTITAPHNVYLEMLAEGGVIGLAGWLLLYSAALFAAVRALRLLRRLDRGPPSGATLLALGTVSGLVAWALASAVLHLADFTALLLVMGLATSLDVRARALAGTRAREIPAIGLSTGPRARLRIRLPVAVGIVVAVSAVAALAAVRAVPQRTSAAIHIPVLVTPAHPNADSYVYDVMSRTAVVASYAALLRNRAVLAAAGRAVGISDLRGTRAEVIETGPSAALALTVRAPSRETAARLAPSLIRTLGTYLTAQAALYVVRDGRTTR
ncbi:MAG: O-antigen ligase family protein [Frankiaceae bacterium]